MSTPKLNNKDVPPIRKPKRMTQETIDQTVNLFRIYREGKHSVRELGRIYNISFSTLRDRFRNLFGVDYASYRSGEGSTYAMIQEHIGMLPDGRHKIQCLKWAEENRVKLLNLSYEEQTARKSRLYTSRRLDRETMANCRMPHDIASSPFLSDESYSPAILEDDEYIYLHSDNTYPNRKSF